MNTTLKRLAVLFATLSLLTSAVVCSTLLADNVAQVDVRIMRTVLIFDPTILTLDRQKEVERTLDAFAMSLEYGPTRNTIDVWVLGPAMIQHPAPLFTLKSQLDLHSIEQSARAVASDFRKRITPALIGAWKSAHDPKNNGRAATCLMTALYCLATSMTSTRSTETVVAVVVSDLLEVCNDWGTVNLEDMVDTDVLGEVEGGIVTDSVKRLINLSKIDRFVVVQMPSPHVKNPTQRSAVESIWRHSLSQLKVKGRVLFYPVVPPAEEMFERGR